MKYSTGKYAKFISDRSGMEFPYNEQMTEWNGSVVHISEFETKQPQLDPKKPPIEPQALKNARPDRTEPQQVFVSDNVFGASGFLQGVSSVGHVTVTTS
tara:strand:- start:349 stop:645 length:297 start_codon:yes stop_codon:yes gene_type:complete